MRPGTDAAAFVRLWGWEGAVGTLVSGVEVRLVSLNGDEQDVGEGEEGQLVARVSVVGIQS
jgi:hypothetical protein